MLVSVILAAEDMVLEDMVVEDMVAAQVMVIPQC